MKLKKIVAMTFATVLAVSTMFGSGIESKNDVSASSAVISQIPGTTRTFSSYNDSFKSVTGFAKDGVNDRSSYVGTSYCVTVNTEREFLNAIKNAQSGTVKIIDVESDLDLGYNYLNLSTTEKSNYSFVSKYEDPTNGYTNPVMETNGVSKLNISNTTGLTILSTTGVSIKHVEFKLQSSSSDLVFRNINFEGMYQFDDTGNHKEVGWTFIKVNGANDVWLDHCSFGVAADGMIDFENGSSGVTLSWCKLGREADESPDTDSAIYQSVTYMETQYNAGNLGTDSRYYKLRKAGASVKQIMAYEAYHSKTHLVGSGDKDYVNYVYSNGTEVLDGNQRLELTLAYNYYLNDGQRLPMIRQGQGHLINCYFDNTSHYAYQKLSAFTSNGCYSLNRGMNARNGASIAADTCVYNGIDSPIIGAECQGDDTANMDSQWANLFQNAYNHSLIVNSKVTNNSGSTYTGSSWDSNGSNLFTTGFTWNDKSTIGNWAWSSSIDGVENMDKSNPPSDPFTFTYNYDETLPYSYQALPLDEVESTVPTYSGAGKVSMSVSDWAKTSYTSSTSTVDTSDLADSDLAEGTYMIKNVNSDKYLDVASGTAANGTNIQQWGASSAASYNSWKLVKDSDGYYTIYSLLGDGNTYVMDVNGVKTTDGANVSIYTYKNGDNQKFQIKKCTDGSYAILTKHTNSQSCVEVESASTGSGANIEQSTYTGSDSQHWIFEKVATSTTVSPSPSTSTTTPSTQTSSSTTSGSALTLDAFASSWTGAYNMNITLKNTSSTAITDWKVTLSTSQADITSIWCAEKTVSGSSIVITPVSYNAGIAAGGSTSIGYGGNGTVPSSLSYTVSYEVNGTWYSYTGTDSSL